MFNEILVLKSDYYNVITDENLQLRTARKTLVNDNQVDRLLSLETA